MKMHHTAIEVFRFLLLMGLMAVGSGGCLPLAGAGGDVLLQPSPDARPFEADRYAGFEDYLVATRKRVSSAIVTPEPLDAKKAFEAALPFEMRPVERCRANEAKAAKNGILLIHGLSDTPSSTRDLAVAFTEYCFLVRSILLPGHGTRPGDLLVANRTDWLNAARFGVSTLAEEVTNVYIGGVSLGGLIAAHLGLSDPRVKGVIAFSPALGINRRWIVGQSVWMRHLVEWADVDPPDDYARYEAMPFNALAETYLLSRDFKKELDERQVTTPFFLAHSKDDTTIDTAFNDFTFRRRFVSPHSRLVVYERNPGSSIDPDDARISYLNSHHPEQRIYGYAHLALHVSPGNPHYGLDGDYRDCGATADRSVASVERCLSETSPPRGEIFAEPNDPGIDVSGMARLTFNPRFGQLMEKIDEFVNRVSAAVP